LLFLHYFKLVFSESLSMQLMISAVKDERSQPNIERTLTIFIHSL
jgi:hypothetical protein